MLRDSGSASKACAALRGIDVLCMSEHMHSGLRLSFQHPPSSVQPSVDTLENRLHFIVDIDLDTPDTITDVR